MIGELRAVKNATELQKIRSAQAVTDKIYEKVLEIVKPGYEQPIDRLSFEKTITLFEKLLQLLHPFMPFITEEIWQNLRERKDGESIMISTLPEVENYQEDFLAEFENVKEIIANIRTLRKQNNIAFKDSITLKVKENKRYPQLFESVIRKMGNVDDIEISQENFQDAWSFISYTV